MGFDTQRPGKSFSELRYHAYGPSRPSVLFITDHPLSSCGDLGLTRWQTHDFMLHKCLQCLFPYLWMWAVMTHRWLWISNVFCYSMVILLAHNSLFDQNGRKNKFGLAVSWAHLQADPILWYCEVELSLLGGLEWLQSGWEAFLLCQQCSLTSFHRATRSN